jgi:hypothetical protein
MLRFFALYLEASCINGGSALRTRRLCHLSSHLAHAAQRITAVPRARRAIQPRQPF